MPEGDPGDWAVARAISDRVRELGWRQHELAERSHVSAAVVREIQRHTVERRRSRRTLEALSVARLRGHVLFMYVIPPGIQRICHETPMQLHCIFRATRSWVMQAQCKSDAITMQVAYGRRMRAIFSGGLLARRASRLAGGHACR